MKGMFNKILTVDLTAGSITDSPLSDEVLMDYLGGRALATKLFIDLIPPHLDPLDPQNPLIFALGPLTGSIVPTAGRSELVTKSPLTGGIFYSNSGGFWGAYLKKCGYDAVVITGALSEPQYLVIDGQEGPSLKDASELWGLDTLETLNKIQEIEGKNSQVLMIGPAGENLVRIAVIMNQGPHRAFGRGGVGAVMGSKKLKAIVVKNGTTKAEIDNDDHLQKYVHAAQDKIKVAPITRSAYPLFGTSGLVNIINEYGMFPINNYQKGYSPEAENISGEAIRSQILVKDEGCFGCPIRCGRLTKAGDMEGKGPEYESVWALGADCGVFDLIKVTQANYYCNLYGIDTISAGGVIACAMELQQKGLIEDAEIHFGNADILAPLLKEIAYKEGRGVDLGEGSTRLAKKYDSPETAMAVKSMELPAYDPRGVSGHALGYATSNRGGDHLTGFMVGMEILAAPKKIDRYVQAGKPDLLALKQNQSVVEDSLIVCKFVGFATGFDFTSRFATAITGYDYNITKLLEIGERTYNLERMFNLREGMTKDDDTLPPRFLNEPLEEGASKGHVVDLANMLPDYYRVRKWDKDGIPTQEKLEQLQINGVITL